MEVKLVRVKGKKPRETKGGKEFIPSYIALELETGKLIFIKPFDSEDYATLFLLATKR